MPRRARFCTIAFVSRPSHCAWSWGCFRVSLHWMRRAVQEVLTPHQRRVFLGATVEEEVSP